MSKKTSSKNMAYNFSEYLNISKKISFEKPPTFLLHAYYPIATIEFDMDERSFEDFTPIDNVILKLIDVGYTGCCKEIADLLGLPENYINDHYKTLYGKGQIDDRGLTSLGKQSLTDNRLILPYNGVRQTFQIDGVSAGILRQKYIRRPSRQIAPADVDTRYMVIKSLETINRNTLENIITSDNFLSRHRGKELNTNVVKINSIDFKKLFYTSTFVVCYDDKALVYLTAFNDDNTVDFVELSELDPQPFKKYSKEIEIDKESIMHYFENSVFNVDEISYEEIDGYSIGSVSISGLKKEKKITINDLEILAASAAPKIPVTIEANAIYDHRKAPVFSFSVSIPETLIPAAQILRKEWNAAKYKSVLYEQTDDPFKTILECCKEG